MRFVVFLVGLVLGIAGTLAYAMFFSTTDTSATATAPVAVEAPITVSLGERFLTGVVQRANVNAEAPQGVNVPAKNLRVVLKDGVIEVHAALTVLGKETTGVASLKPTVRDGRLVIEVVDTNLGTMPLAPMEKVLEEQINTRIASMLDGMPVTITGAQVDRVRGLTLTCEVPLDVVAGPAPSS